MLAKMLKLDNRISFYLFFLVSFSTISFAFIFEQYIISLFYIILILYIYFETKSELNYAYLGGVGTVTTTGILFPFMAKFHNLKDWLKKALKVIGVLIIIFILFGQLSQIFSLMDNINDNLSSFTGKNSLNDRFMGYLNFVKGIFIALPGSEVFLSHDIAPHMAYYINPVNGYSILGIIFLVICVLSLILNRKNKIAIVSAFW